MANFSETLQCVRRRLNKSALILSFSLAYIFIGVFGYDAFPIPVFRTYTVEWVDTDNVERERTFLKYPDKKSLIVQAMNKNMEISIKTNYHLQHGVFEGFIAFFLFSLAFHFRPGLMVRLFKIKSDLFDKLRNRSRDAHKVREIE